MKSRRHPGARGGGSDRHGPSQRQLRVGEAVRHALTTILDRDSVHDPDLAGVSVTVSEVSMSPDLRHATAHIVPLGGAEAERIVGALNRAAPALRRLLAPALSMKFLPALHFAFDSRFDEADRIDRLLAEARARRPALADAPEDDAAFDPEAEDGA